MNALLDKSKNYVAGTGPLDCKIAFIGEAPGAVENRLMRPFCGPAGELLDTLLRSSGILRSSCYLTNVIKEQPNNNAIDIFTGKNSRGTFKLTPEYIEYEKILYEELRSCSANVLVPLGNVALYSLCRLGAITKRHGSTLRALSELGERKVIPTIHPSAALKQFLHRYTILNDLRKIARESLFPEIKLPERCLRIGPSFHEAIYFLDQCIRHGRQTPLAFDIEVVNESLSCFSVGWQADTIMSIPLVGPHGDYFDPEQECTILKMLAALIEDPEIQLENQNVNFDLSFLYDRYGMRPRNIHGDTMVAHGILWPDFPKGLDFITAHYTDEPYYKDDGKKHFKIGGAFENFWIYNAKDSAVVLDAQPKLDLDLEKSGNMEVYKRQVSLIEPLIFMQARGIQVDVEGLKEAKKIAEAELQKLQQEFEALAPGVSPSSPKQLCSYFYETLGLPVYTSLITHKPTTDALALKRLARKGIKAAQILLQTRKLDKLINTYFNMKFDSDNRLRCSFNPVGTTTGRLSSSRTIFGTGGNMQNLPPIMKKHMLADIGYLLYEVDLSQAEDRAIAYIAPEPNKQKAYESGIDPHCQTAALIFNKAPHLISDVPGSSSLGGGLFSERAWGKRANHALNYGLGANKFSLMYEIPLAEAKFIWEKYHQAYRGLDQYYAWVKNQLQQDRTLITPYGRRRRFLDRWGDELFKAAYAFLPQSTIGDHLNLYGLIPLYYEQDKFKHVELLNQVHDSVVFQIPIACGFMEHALVLLALKTSLQTPIKWHTASFVVPADCKVGLNLGSKHTVDWNTYPTVDTLAVHLATVNKELERLPMNLPEEDEDEIALPEDEEALI